MCKDLSDGGFHPTEKVEIPKNFHLQGRTTNKGLFLNFLHISPII